MNRRVTHLAHELIGAIVKAGDIVVDATAGNGYDTVFLAGLVGDKGVVHAFDIQQVALAATAARLASQGLSAKLHLVSHATMAHQVSSAKAVMFNLGYLPGADHEMITEPSSTLRALKAALHILLPGGLLTCICYPGHPGGAEEAEAVLNWGRRQQDHELITAHEKERFEGRPFLVALKKALV